MNRQAMKDFRFYKECFATLHTAKVGKLPAPHKPLLLLSVIDLVERGVIASNKIELSDALVRTFKLNANRFLGHSVVFRPNIGQPFYHMQSEPFWRLVPERSQMVSGVAAEPINTVPEKKVTYSVKGLRERYWYAEIDIELFELLLNEDVRAKFRTSLISWYLSQQPNSISPLGSITLIIASLSFIA